MIKRYRIPIRLLNDDRNFDMKPRRGPKYLSSRQRGAVSGLEDVRWTWLSIGDTDGILEAEVSLQQHRLLTSFFDVTEI